MKIFSLLYRFVLVMEVLSRLLNDAAKAGKIIVAKSNSIIYALLMI